jgi:hypothetical protein
VITPDSLRNPSLKAGFHHVGKVGGQPSRGSTPIYYQAYAGRGRTGDWKGPGRKSAVEAAQDYCDYVNGQATTPATHAPLKVAGHGGKREALPRDPEVEAALGVLRDARAQRNGVPGYVYLITEDRLGGGIRYVKIGYSVNPQKRVAELQTGNPRLLKLLYAMPGTPEDERRLHAKYAKHNVLQEWFEVTKELILEFPPETAAASSGGRPKEVNTTS